MLFMYIRTKGAPWKHFLHIFSKICDHASLEDPKGIVTSAPKKFKYSPSCGSSYYWFQESNIWRWGILQWCMGILQWCSGILQWCSCEISWRLVSCSKQWHDHNRPRIIWFDQVRSSCTAERRCRATTLPRPCCQSIWCWVDWSHAQCWPVRLNICLVEREAVLKTAVCIVCYRWGRRIGCQLQGSRPSLWQ